MHPRLRRQLSPGLSRAIEDIRASGAKSLPAIAAELNSRKIKSARGGSWYAGTVANLLARK